MKSNHGAGDTAFLIIAGTLLGLVTSFGLYAAGVSEYVAVPLGPVMVALLVAHAMLSKD